MAQNISLWGANYSNVPAIDLPKTGGGEARFADPSITTAVEADVASGKIFLKVDGSQGVGTGSGGVDGDNLAYGGAIVGLAIVGEAIVGYETAIVGSAIVGTAIAG